MISLLNRTESVLVPHLVLWAGYLTCRAGPTFRPGGSLQTGNGPLHAQTYLLYCKKALWRGEGGRVRSGHKLTSSNIPLFKAWLASSTNNKTETQKHMMTLEIIAIRFGATLPLRPSPMKILYRSELHRTTPTNFLYQVRLTYWLPLQALCVGLNLKVKGIQIGSPPEVGE